uniref:Uncharacterized protein n=1 Tax=Anguilla anguilla TaxID=7936 RepID=A0A0E9Q103_ANGAN
MYVKTIIYISAQQDRCLSGEAREWTQTQSQKYSKAKSGDTKTKPRRASLKLSKISS